MRYELIREIFNNCSRNQMRDVFVSEVETDDTDEVVRQYLIGGEITVDKHRSDIGEVIYDVVIDGLRQRFSFSEE